jgi:hypothetical protein
MSGILNIAKQASFHEQVARPKVYLAPTVRREQPTSLDAVLCALLVTVGLFGGAVALLPQAVLAQLPLVHIALAFFVPFSTLFALTSLNLKTVIRSVVHGFLAALVVGALGLIIA